MHRNGYVVSSAKREIFNHVTSFSTHTRYQNQLSPHSNTTLTRASRSNIGTKFKKCIQHDRKGLFHGHQIFFRALSQRALLKEKMKLEARTRSVSVANSDNVVRQALHRLNGHRRITTEEETGECGKTTVLDLTT